MKRIRVCVFVVGQRNIKNYFCLKTRSEWLSEVWNPFTSVSQVQSLWREFILPILTSAVEKEAVKTDLTENCSFK